MKILALNWGTNSSAALMVDGQIIGCVSEERFSRVKNDESYPLRAIEAVLESAGITAHDCDLIAIASESFDVMATLCHKYSRLNIQERIREQHDYWYPRLYHGKRVSYLDVFQDKLDLGQYPGPEAWNKVVEFLRSEQDAAKVKEYFMNFRRDIVEKHLGVPRSRIAFSHHTKAHALYAYYGSPFRGERVAILTAEGWGDDMNASVSLAHNGSIEMLSSSGNFMIGRYYRNITQLLGMRPDEHEYKVMGLAAYARPEYYRDVYAVLANTMYVDDLKFAYNEVPKDSYFYFKEKFEGARFDSIAGALQKYTEDILVKWSQNALRATGAKRLCFGGGVGMNIKAMMEIGKVPELEELFMCPSPSDDSLAIGAAYAAMHDCCLKSGKNPDLVIQPLGHAYLGPANQQNELEAIFKKAADAGHAVQKNADPRSVATLVAEGKIVGRSAGKSEFGARALGNRSILADPRKPELIKVINDRIKCRDFWMPFAPSILEEMSDKYLVNPKHLKSPFMTLAFDSTPRARVDLKAALHQADLSLRPQLVSKKSNSEFHELLTAFSDLTGVGGMLNTSFNIHGEPIVQSAEDAYSVFERSELDALVLENTLIRRKA